MRRATLIFVMFLLVASGAPAFDNLDNHWRLADQSMSRDRDRLDRDLEVQLGLEKGLNTGLAFQVGFSSAERIEHVDNLYERLTRNLNRDPRHPFRETPLAGLISALINTDSPCPQDAAFADCFSAKERSPVDLWIRLGTFAEDNPNPRAKHHFHLPAEAGGSHGLDDGNRALFGLDALLVEPFTALYRGGDWRRALAGTLLFPATAFTDWDISNFNFTGLDAVDRALNTTQGGDAPSARYPENFFALPDAERYLYRAFTAPSRDEREHFLALHFLAVGHVLHLLQDMGSVAHTRNDFWVDHVWAPEVLGLTTLESAAKDKSVAEDVVKAIRAAGLVASLPRQFIAKNAGYGAPPDPYAAFVEPPLAAAFDYSDIWDEGSLNDPSGGGLAEFVHRNFFSAATVGAYEGPDLPACSQPGAAGATPEWVGDLPARDLNTGQTVTGLDRFVSSSLVPHLARCSLHCHEFDGRSPKTNEAWCATVIDESVQRDYLELLWPQVIHYGQKFLELYYEPRIDVVPLGEPEGSFRLVNRSRFSFRFDSAELRAWYDDVEGGRSFVPLSCDASGELAAGEGTTCSFVGPPSIAPRSRGEFAIVVRGQLGSRGTVVGPDDAWETADFVTAVKQVFGWRIAYEGGSAEDVDHDGHPYLDEESRSNVSVIGFDLQGALDGRPRAVEVDLTADLRAQIPNPAVRETVDFLSPSAEPKGTRIAFSSDLRNEQGQVAGTGPDDDGFGIPIPSELRVLDLLDPEALVASWSTPLVPPSVDGVEQIPSCDFDCPPAWNEDGAEDALYFTSSPATNWLIQKNFARIPIGGGGGSVGEWPDSFLSMHIVSVHGSRAVGYSNESHEALTDAAVLFLADLASGQRTQMLELTRTGMQVKPWNPNEPASSQLPPREERLYPADPRFSPDGTRLVFAVYDEPVVTPHEPDEFGFNLRHNGDLYVLDLTSGQFRRIELGDANGRAAFPSWSPDGAWISFQRQQATPTGVFPDHFFLVPANGSGPPVQVSSQIAHREEASWLPTLLLPQ